MRKNSGVESCALLRLGVKGRSVVPLGVAEFSSGANRLIVRVAGEAGKSLRVSNVQCSVKHAGDGALWVYDILPTGKLELIADQAGAIGVATFSASKYATIERRVVAGIGKELSIVLQRN